MAVSRPSLTAAVLSVCERPPVATSAGSIAGAKSIPMRSTAARRGLELVASGSTDLYAGAIHAKAVVGAATGAALSGGYARLAVGGDVYAYSILSQATGVSLTTADGGDISVGGDVYAKSILGQAVGFYANSSREVILSAVSTYARSVLNNATGVELRNTPLIQIYGNVGAHSIDGSARGSTHNRRPSSCKSACIHGDINAYSLAGTRHGRPMYLPAAPSPALIAYGNVTAYSKVGYATGVIVDDSSSGFALADVLGNVSAMGQEGGIGVEAYRGDDWPKPSLETSTPKASTARRPASR